MKTQSYTDASSSDGQFPRNFDPWRTLNLKPAARTNAKTPSAEEVKNAYKTLAKQYHPDKCSRNGGGGREKCEKKMSEIALARDIFSDASGRRLQQWEVWRGKAGSASSGGRAGRRGWGGQRGAGGGRMREEL